MNDDIVAIRWGGETAITRRLADRLEVVALVETEDPDSTIDLIGHPIQVNASGEIEDAAGEPVWDSVLAEVFRRL